MRLSCISFDECMRRLSDLLQLAEGFARLLVKAGDPAQCSIGLVTFDRPPASARELLSAGDEFMCRAKHSGKYCVEQAERAGSCADREPSTPVRDQVRLPPVWHTPRGVESC